ncbi:STAS-like domain-containing protein [Novosphingobium sp.]|uniref:STAS-like domain-containing protein n=1 Tax=Novosphingobium sp. TaxID=1874826 RepID=UPI0026248F9B|nr:STAS-like domain-containing protein [Novosphingobium sp.]
MKRDVEQSVIDIAKDFTRFPAGRYKSDGPYSGERFRDDILIPALRKHGAVVLKLDGTMGYGSSFLEEVFGGLVRSKQFDQPRLLTSIQLETRDPSLVSEIKEYLSATYH